jgi:hypothetical protein
MSTVGPALFSLVFVAIGAAILLYARSIAGKARRSLSWPSTEGMISHSAVLYRPGAGSDDRDPGTYAPDVCYRYKVRGMSYSSSTITLADFSSTARRAQSIIDRYPDQSSVVVYYNPADPAESLLERGAPTGLTLFYLIGGAFAVAGTFFLIMASTRHI